MRGRSIGMSLRSSSNTCEIPCRGLFFLHRGDEAKSSVANCANQALLAAVITNDTASGIDAGGERGLRDVATVPNNLQEVVLPRYQ